MNNVFLRFDMRAPAELGACSAELFPAAVEMSEWADHEGLGFVALSEHHMTNDGYLPSPLALAAAIAARTESLMLNISALLVALYDPIKLAEDVAVVDILSNGRLTITAGLGYREIEYDAFDVNWKSRGRRFEANLRTMMQAWTGEPFEFRGTLCQVLPRPVSRPHPFIMVGGGSSYAAKRAARLHLPFAPAIDDEELRSVYETECQNQGYNEGFVIMPNEPATLYLAEDPDRAWAEVGKHLLYEATAYGAWKHPTRRAYAESGAQTIEELRREGKYRILTPDEAVSYYNEKRHLHFAPLVVRNGDFTSNVCYDAPCPHRSSWLRTNVVNCNREVGLEACVPRTYDVPG